MEENNMEEKKSAKSLFEMKHNEAQKIIKRRKDDKDYPVLQIQFGRFANHCLKCDKCRIEAEEVGLLVSSES